MSNVLIVLKAARELLSDEKRWVKNNPTVWKSKPLYWGAMLKGAWYHETEVPS